MVGLAVVVACAGAVTWAVIELVRQGYDPYADDVGDYAEGSDDWRRVRARNRRAGAAIAILTVAFPTAISALVGVVLVGTGIVGHHRAASIVTMTVVGLGVGVVVLARSTRLDRERRQKRARGQSPVDRRSTLALVRTIVAVELAATGIIVVIDAHTETGWSSDWRISFGMGLLVSSAVIVLLAEPIDDEHRRPGRFRPIVAPKLALAAILMGPVLVVVAGRRDHLTDFVQALLTEAGVGLMLVGVVEMGASRIFRRVENSDENVDAAVNDLLDAAVGNEALLVGEERALRAMLPRQPAFPMLWGDLHVDELAGELKAARSPEVADAANARQHRCQARKQAVRAAAEVHAGEVKRLFDLGEKQVRLLRSFAVDLADDPTVMAVDVLAELWAYARWLRDCTSADE